MDQPSFLTREIMRNSRLNDEEKAEMIQEDHKRAAYALMDEDERTVIKQLQSLFQGIAEQHPHWTPPQEWPKSWLNENQPEPPTAYYYYDGEPLEQEDEFEEQPSESEFEEEVEEDLPTGRHRMYQRM
jgi:hypothetical protein